MARLKTLEKNREKVFMRHGERRGVMVLKVMVIGMAGFPDRMCIARPGRVAFAELKQENKKIKGLQIWWREKLTEFGFQARQVRTLDEIDEFYDDWLGEI